MRFWTLLIVLAVVVGGLMWKFPYVMQSADESSRILYLVMMLLLIGTSSGIARSMSRTEAMRDAMLWLGIILILSLGYSYRHDLKSTRIYGIFNPGSVRTVGSDALQVHAAEGGHFFIIIDINGAPERFLVDTGASDIVLSPRAAQAAGFDLSSLNYSRAYSTANGTGAGAPVRIETLDIGPLRLRDVPASVNNAPMSESLLGMSFLNLFASYTFEGDTLTLYPQ